MLHSVINPGNEGTDGRVNDAEHVFIGTVREGGAGKTTALMVLSWQAGKVLTALTGA